MAENRRRSRVVSPWLRRGALLVCRLGRKGFWRDPALYRWLGRLRRHGDCLNHDYDVWIDGYPGSASALASAAFQKGNPDARIAPPRHLPPFILQALHQFKPGFLLVSPPEEAVISWAALSGGSLAECLDYYNDFHLALAPNAPWLFVLTPGELSTQFAEAIEAFNLHFDTRFTAPAENPAASFFGPAVMTAPPTAAPAGELRISRPPAAGPASIRRELRTSLHESPALKRKLARARQLYTVFVPNTRRAPIAPFNVSTRHLPALV